MTILLYSIGVHTQSIGIQSTLIGVLIPIILSWAFFLQTRWHGRRKYDLDSTYLVTRKGLDPTRCLLSRWKRKIDTYLIVSVVNQGERKNIFVENGVLDFFKCDSVL